MESMNVNVDLHLDPVVFYQQKMLLVELTDKLFDTYHNGDLDNMLQGIIAIFDEIGDQGEFQGEFEYPEITEDGEHFKDEQYNNVFGKLFNHKPLDEPLFTTSSQIVDATFTSNWDDGSYFDAPCKVDLLTHRVFNIGCAGCPSEDAEIKSTTVTIDGKVYPCIDADNMAYPPIAPDEIKGMSVDEVIEYCNWDMTEDKNGNITLESHSPAGEDLIIETTRDSLVDDLRAEAENFDPDEHAEMWAESRGTRGVPESIRTLVEDADAIQQKYFQLSNAVEMAERMQEKASHNDIVDLDDKEETSVFTDDAYWYGDKNPLYGCLN